MHACVFVEGEKKERKKGKKKRVVTNIHSTLLIEICIETRCLLVGLWLTCTATHGVCVFVCFVRENRCKKGDNNNKKNGSVTNKHKEKKKGAIKQKGKKRDR